MMSIRIDDDPPTVVASGEIDYTNSSKLREALQSLMDRGCCTPELDMSGVRFVDSSAIRVLLEFAGALSERGGVLKAIQPSSTVSHTLRRLGLTQTPGLVLDEPPAAVEDTAGRALPKQFLVSSFKVTAGPLAPHEVREQIGVLVAGLPFSDAEISDIKLAVGEAVTNAVKHGCRGKGEPISVSCLADGRALTIEIADPGRGFDPDILCPPQFMDLPTNGMGISIMRMTMDRVEFDFARGTTVRLVKFFPSPLKVSGSA